jgi:hypothetical protein
LPGVQATNQATNPGHAAKQQASTVVPDWLPPPPEATRRCAGHRVVRWTHFPAPTWRVLFGADRSSRRVGKSTRAKNLLRNKWQRSIELAQGRSATLARGGQLGHGQSSQAYGVCRRGTGDPDVSHRPGLSGWNVTAGALMPNVVHCGGASTYARRHLPSGWAVLTQSRAARGAPPRTPNRRASGGAAPRRRRVVMRVDASEVVPW